MLSAGDGTQPRLFNAEVRKLPSSATLPKQATSLRQSDAHRGTPSSPRQHHMDHPRRAAAGGVVAPGAAIVVLTVTCALAIHRAAAARDAASVAFVAVSYAALLLLLRSLRAYELALAAADATERGPLMRRVWALSALLTAMFAWKVAAAVPWWPAAVLVWAAAAATSAAGFFALSLHRRP